jgi:hypothetical protein
MRPRCAAAAIVAAGEAEVGVALAEAVTAADQMAHGDAADHREAMRRGSTKRQRTDIKPSTAKIEVHHPSIIEWDRFTRSVFNWKA